MAHTSDAKLFKLRQSVTLTQNETPNRCHHSDQIIRQSRLIFMAKLTLFSRFPFVLSDTQALRCRFTRVD